MAKRQPNRPGIRLRRCACPLLCLLPLCAVSPAAAVNYVLDPIATTTSFEVKLLGLFPIRGGFARTHGVLRYDPASREGEIDVRIDTASLKAGSDSARNSARGPDFFNVDKYPVIAFKSSRFVFEEARLAAVEGALTLTGTTRPVTLTVAHAHCGIVAEIEARAKAEPDKTAPICRAEAELRVKRSQYGMRAWSHTVGDEVLIRIDIFARATPTADAAKAGEPAAESIAPPAEKPAAPPPQRPAETVRTDGRA